MKLRKLRKNEKRPHLHVWVDPELKKAIDEAADEARMTVSDWVRDRLFSAVSAESLGRTESSPAPAVARFR